MRITKTTNGKQKINISKKEWETMGKKAGWMNDLMEEEEYGNDAEYEDAHPQIELPLGMGDSVKLKDDALQQHSRSVPAHAGYTPEQFAWRDTLSNLAGKVGEITRIFPNSKHVNVQFEGALIGIDIDQLEKV